ncbi:hypothetical protein BT67DRAFT_256525 [Trichocladium antarcticum]|uniref:Uncharacterized protein n=1 Tax=Trichocladium antarcticum TaxID=1450529 RepID=A0AAN6UMI8_9PEZI|nr:hypothetical protein BT67DRAFT_256525 [Trichocladium antarcticum]
MVSDDAAPLSTRDRATATASHGYFQPSMDGQVLEGQHAHCCVMDRRDCIKTVAAKGHWSRQGTGNGCGVSLAVPRHCGLQEGQRNVRQGRVGVRGPVSHRPGRWGTGPVWCKVVVSLLEWPDYRLLHRFLARCRILRYLWAAPSEDPVRVVHNPAATAWDLRRHSGI